MKAFLALLKVYVTSTYNPRGIVDTFRDGPKGVAKGIGMIVLILYMVGAFGAMMFFSSYSSYAGLKSVGLQKLVLLNGVSSATAIVLILGFITCLATYFMSEAESVLIAMPLKPRALFGAKFAMTYISEAALAILMIGVSAGVYAYFEHPPLLFYPYLLIIALATPLLPLAFFYLLLVPLMTRVRFLRRKDTVIVLGGILGIFLAMGWQIFYQKMARNSGNLEWLLASYADPNSVLQRFTRFFPPAVFAAEALSAPQRLGGLAWLCAFLGTQAAALAAALLLLPGPYARSLSGFNESFMKRLASSRAFIGKTIRSRSPLASCLLREWRQMNREPVFFLNGPFIVFLMPIILGVVYGSMRKDFVRDIPGLADPGAAPVLGLVAFGLAAWLGSGNGVACTSISREGTQFAFLKSLPMDVRAYLGAKLLHGMAFGLFASAAGPCLVAFLLPLPAINALQAGYGAFGLSTLLNVAGLFLDTAHPRLSWPNPTVAIKQNLNYLAMVLGGMVLIGGLCFILFPFIGLPYLLALVGSIALGLAAGLYALYLKWAPGRLSRIEI
jgi:ABC-2 type transport system permease protein